MAMGEAIIIPGWVWGAIIGVLFVWMIRITFMVFSSQEEIRVQKERDNGVKEKLEALEEKIEDNKEDFHGSMNKLETKFEKLTIKVDSVYELLLRATK